MSKIIEFPKGNTRQEQDQPLDEFLRENFDPAKMDGVKGIAAVLFMENGECEFVLSHLSWAEVLWCAVRLGLFATGNEDEDE